MTFNNKCSECEKKELSKKDLDTIINTGMCCQCHEQFLTQEQNANESYE